MKRFTSLLFGALCIVLFAAAAKAPVKSLLFDNNGNWLVIKNQVIQRSKALSKEDFTHIAKVARGISETDKVNTTVYEDAVNQTVTKNKTDLKASAAGREILAVLKKYSPQRTEQGILIINNQVVQASKPLSRDDLNKMRTISQENKAASSFVNKKVYKDAIDESVWSTGLKKGDPDLRAEYARVMDKYLR